MGQKNSNIRRIIKINTAEHTREEKNYGSWTSSLTAKKLAKKGIRFGHMCVDGNDLYWLESRASENGRSVLVKSDHSGNLLDVLPKNINVKTKVHEYGSGDFFVDNKIIYYVNAIDQCIYRYDSNCIDSQPVKLTIVLNGLEKRYADFSISNDKKYLVCIRETHQAEQVINELVSLSLKENKYYLDLIESSMANVEFNVALNTSLKVTSNSASSSALNASSKLSLNQSFSTIESIADINVLHSGYDFYSFPRFSLSTNQLCWTCWNQPDMPWQATELWQGDFSFDGGIENAKRIIGGHNGESEQSIYQPSWSDDNVLHFISDASNWTNIYSFRDNILNALAPVDRDFGIPQWVLASSTYALAQENKVYAIYLDKGQQQLCCIDELTGHVEPIALPFKSFGEHLLISGNYLYFCAAGPAIDEAVYSFDLSKEKLTQLSSLNQFPLAIEEISIARAIEFESKNSRVCYGFYYEPKNTHFSGLKNTKPPLIVMSHGGPTAMTNNALNVTIQFWTQRGFAVVDVNYAGSTGFGKKYRNLLNNYWGIVDVEDCIAAAQYLVREGLADEKALLIRGGSAGGYTTLCALTYFDIFAAGMSRYGVADLESLATDSHKFEARYLDSLVGPYPQEKALYQSRSPIHSANQLSCPILLLQGKDDKVVPPNQAEMMVEALTKNKIPFAYQLYEGEGHGFRQEKTIVHALNAELYFYRKVLNIENCETLVEIEIKFLSEKRVLVNGY